VRIYTLRQMDAEKSYLRVSYFILPNLSAFPGQTGGEGYSVNWHVPIDDVQHWKYTFIYSSGAPLDKAVVARERSELMSDYRLVRNTANRYLQDRESMKTWSFSGMGRIFNVQDTAIVEGSGSIVDRTREFLGPSDRAIILARRQVLKAIRDLQTGREVPHVIRSARENRFPDLTVISEVITDGGDWRIHWKNKLAALE
jgi:hypothetical protein